MKQPFVEKSLLMEEASRLRRGACNLHGCYEVLSVLSPSFLRYCLRLVLVVSILLLEIQPSHSTLDSC